MDPSASNSNSGGEKPLRVDTQRLFCYGNGPEIRELLALFMQTARDNLAEMILCASPEERNKAAAAAHRLRGSAVSIGAMALVAQVRKMEEHLRRHPAGHWAQAMAELHLEYEATCAALNSLDLEGLNNPRD